MQDYDGFRNLFITPVWGDDFVSEFLEVSLPTQLSDQNLGMLEPTESVYCIVTSKAGKRQIENSDLFPTLRAHVSVQFIVYEDSIISSRGSYDLMHDMYNRSLANVKCAINCFFLSADIFCSNGLFARAIASMKRGKKVVFVPTVRVSRTSFLGAVKQSGVTSPTPDQMVDLILRHELEITRAGVVNDASGAIFSLPHHTLYRMHNGYVGRWNVMHPLAVRVPANPARISLTVDWNYGVLNVLNPEDIEIFWDSDDGLVLTTAPEGYTQGGDIVYHGTTEQRTHNLVRWLGYGWALKIHLLQMSEFACLHSGPIDHQEYAEGVAAVDHVWKPFSAILTKHATEAGSDYNKFLNSPLVTSNSSRWIRLRSDPTGLVRGAFRRIFRTVARVSRRAWEFAL